MRARFEELDWQETPMGAISLRRRFDPVTKVDVYEVKLGEEFLMTSLFTFGETELARLGMAEASGETLDVVVGGLGLGYTARAVLDDPRVTSVTVVEALGQVIDWHQRRLLPVSDELALGSRTRFVSADFFAAASGSDGFDPDVPGRKFDAILLDIDHSPRHLLNEAHAGFYTRDGLRSLRAHLHAGGVFALWSNDPPDTDFTSMLCEVFADVEAHVVAFANPLQGGESTNTVYTARRDALPTSA